MSSISKPTMVECILSIIERVEERVMFRLLVTTCLAVVIAFATTPGSLFAFTPPSTPPGQSGDSPGNSGNAPGHNKGNDDSNNQGQDQGQTQTGPDESGLSDPTPATRRAKIVWGMSPQEVADQLLTAGSVIIPFQTTGALENIGFWLTPSLDPYLEVLTEPYEALDPDTEYTVEIVLRGDAPEMTIGGTLHLVPVEPSSDGLRRTYAKPLPIVVHVPGAGVSDDEDDPVEEPQELQILGSASYNGDAIAPLEIVSVFGFGIGPDDFEPAIIEDGKITDYLADVQVFFDGTAAPILFASDQQLNVIVPSDVAGKSEVTLTVTYQGNTWEVEGIPVVDAVPEIFSMNGLGHGLAAALDSDGQLITADNPVSPGDWITFFGTGVGLWKDGFIDGTVVSSEDLPRPKKPVEVTIGRAEAPVIYVGGAPGLVNAVVQFNVVVPTDMPDVDETTEPPSARIQVTSAGHPSKADIYIYIGPAAPVE